MELAGETPAKHFYRAGEPPHGGSGQWLVVSLLNWFKAERREPSGMATSK